MTILSLTEIGIGNVAINDYLEVGQPTTGFGSASVADGASKHAHFGRIIWSDGGTHNIASISTRYGTNTTGTATFRISLQDVATTTPAHPDGVVDQSWESATPPASGSWTETTFASVRPSVAHGTLLAVVWDYSAFTSGSVFAPGYYAVDSSSRDMTAHPMNFNGASWGIPGDSKISPVVFKSDDASPVYGTFQKVFPAKTATQHAYNNTSNPKVHALSYTPLCDQRLNLVRFRAFGASTSADFDVVLYDGSGSVLASTSIDADQLTQSPVGTLLTFSVPLIYTLSKNTNYRIGIRPTTANNVTIYSFDLNDAAYRSILKGGSQLAYTSLSSGDVWAADTTTRIPLIALELSGFSTGGGTFNIGFGGGING